MNWSLLLSLKCTVAQTEGSECNTAQSFEKQASTPMLQYNSLTYRLASPVATNNEWSWLCYFYCCTQGRLDSCFLLTLDFYEATWLNCEFTFFMPQWNHLQFSIHRRQRRPHQSLRWQEVEDMTDQLLMDGRPDQVFEIHCRSTAHDHHYLVYFTHSWSPEDEA